MGPGNHQPHGMKAQAGTCAVPLVPAGFTEAQRYVERDVAAGFAHELNQPLAAIAAYADGAARLLRATGNVPETLRIVEAISGQALRAGAVIQQLRDAVPVQPGASLSLDPDALIRTIQPLLTSMADQRDVRLLVALRTPASLILGDADRLRALLVLLVGNALGSVGELPPASRRLTISTDECGPNVELAATGPHGRLFQLLLPRTSSGATSSATT